MNVIDVAGLVRAYQGVRGVAGLDLTVPQGSVMGLLGTNGSGKTTAIKLLLGQLVPNLGRIQVWGEDPLELDPYTRSRIAYVADEVELPEWMKLQEGMELYASYYPQWDEAVAKALIDRFSLEMAQRFSHLSKGQKRRFFLVLAIAQQPDLIVLDEPTGGLDTIVRRDFLDLLMEVRNERDVTILLSSHIITDVERVIDRVAFVADGRLLLQDDLDDLKARVKRICVPVDSDVAPVLARFDLISQTTTGSTRKIHVANYSPDRLEGLDVVVEHLNLEEIFLAYHQSEAAGAGAQQ